MALSNCSPHGRRDPDSIVGLVHNREKCRKIRSRRTYRTAYGVEFNDRKTLGVLESVFRRLNNREPNLQ